MALSDALGGVTEDVEEREYRLVALALAAVGVVAAAAGILLRASQSSEVLFALAGVGLYGGVLLFWLRVGGTDDRATDRIYDAHRETLDELAFDLSLRDTRIYLPITDTKDDALDTDSSAASSRNAPGTDSSDAPSRIAPVRLFLPAPGDDGLPQRDAVDAVFASGGSYDGAVVYPTGAALWTAFEDMTTSELSDAPSDLAGHLAEGAVGGLELAGAVDVTVDRDDGAVNVAVTDTRYGPVTGTDHPVVSFIATGLALGLDRPIEVTPLDDTHFECSYSLE